MNNNDITLQDVCNACSKLLCIRTFGYINIFVSANSPLFDDLVASSICIDNLAPEVLQLQFAQLLKDEAEKILKEKDTVVFDFNQEGASDCTISPFCSDDLLNVMNHMPQLLEHSDYWFPDPIIIIINTICIYGPLLEMDMQFSQNIRNLL